MLIVIGPRKTTLIYSMAPIFSLIGGYFNIDAIASFPFWRHSLSLYMWIVIIERGEEEEKRNKIKGVPLGITAAAGPGYRRGDIQVRHA